MPNYLSKVQLDKLYEIKDAFAREELGKLGTVATHDIATAISDVDGKIADAATVEAYVDAQVGSIHKFDVKIYTELPAASKDTMFILGLVAEAGAVDGSYVEYITVENPSGTYTWEKIGTTQTDLADYVKKTLTIAGIDLADNITADELKTALGLKALAFKDSAKGTVAGQTISGVKATGNSAGSIDVVLTQTPTAATVATKTQAITGGVTGTVVANGSVGIAKSDAGTQISGTVSAPTVTVTPWRLPSRRATPSRYHLSPVSLHLPFQHLSDSFSPSFLLFHPSLSVFDMDNNNSSSDNSNFLSAY